MLEVTGNLWTYPADVRVITTNGFVKKNGEAVMGRGCALEAKKLIPGIEKYLGNRIKRDGNLPTYLAEYNSCAIWSFPVKHNWYEKADITLIEQSALLFVPTPGGPNNPGEMIVPVSINEWMPGNLRILADPADREFEDWFELHNRGTTTIDLTGYFLSDETTNSTKFKIPFGYTIPAGGFLLVWADEETAQNVSTNIDLHVNFKLSRDGDTIAIFTPNGARLDSATFPGLLDNFSGGRYPDGSNSIFTFSTATPRAANIAPAGTRFTRIEWDGAQLVVGWRTTVGRTYRLEFKGDLNDPNWTPSGADVKATGSTTTVNANAPSNRFFRVLQLD